MCKPSASWRNGEPCRVTNSRRARVDSSTAYLPLFYSSFFLLVLHRRSIPHVASRRFAEASANAKERRDFATRKQDAYYQRWPVGCLSGWKIASRTRSGSSSSRLRYPVFHNFRLIRPSNLLPIRSWHLRNWVCALCAYNVYKASRI